MRCLVKKHSCPVVSNVFKQLTTEIVPFLPAFPWIVAKCSWHILTSIVHLRGTTNNIKERKHLNYFSTLIGLPFVIDSFFQLTSSFNGIPYFVTLVLIGWHAKSSYVQEMSVRRFMNNIDSISEHSLV